MSLDGTRSLAIIASILVPAAAAAAPDRFTPVPLVLTPAHSEELFAADGGPWGRGPVPVFRGDVAVTVVEFELRPVQAARFQILDGSRWRTFDTDRRDESLSTGNNADTLHEIYDGEVGFVGHLDTTALAEGVHELRVQLVAHGRRGEAHVAIRVMDAPPRIRIVEPPETSVAADATDPPGAGQEEARLHYTEVAGIHDVVVEPAGPGLTHFDLYEGSPPDHDQTGQGGLKQRDLGPNSSNQDPDTGALQNMYCAPAGAANAMWAQAGRDPRIKKGTKSDGSGWLAFIKACIAALKAKYPDDPKETFDFGEEIAAFFAAKTDASYVDAAGDLTLEGLGMVLACKMKTDPIDGTTAANLGAGIDDFLKEQGIDADYAGTSWDVKTDGNDDPSDPPHPGKRKAIEEIAKDEMVLLVVQDLKGRKHLVTGKDYKDDGKGRATISIRDPEGNLTPDCPVGRDQNGNTCIRFAGKWWCIVQIVSRSPTDAARVRFAMDAFRRLAEDLFGFFSWNTAAEHDGFHALRATRCTAEGACGSDMARFYVNNLPPLPRVQAVAMGPMVTMTVCDQAGSEDVIAWRVQVSTSSTQGGWLPPSCTTTQLGPFAPGFYPWTAVLEDYSGRMATQDGVVRVF